MSYIANPVFSETEKAHLEFMLQFDFQGKAAVIEQLNTIKEADITRDFTPHYWIIEFRPNGANPNHGAMRPYIRLSVEHDSSAPTVFTLYERNGIVFELEIFNADSSELNLTAITNGQIHLS